MPYVKNLSTATNPSGDSVAEQTKTPPFDESEPNATINPDDFTYSGDMAAIDFPQDSIWLNTDNPISSIEELNGKIIILDFWSYGCVICQEVQKELIQLQNEYPDSLVIIGVHSAKYPTDTDYDVILDAIDQNNIPFPVIIDTDFTIWHDYGITAWPTVLLIDPLGGIVGQHTGLGVNETYRPILNNIKYEYGTVADLISDEIFFSNHSSAPSRELLSYPKSVLSDSQTNRLFISDTNHNRLVVSTLEGEILYVIGQGEAGLSDGNYFEAQFSSPEGLALSDDKQTLYVADTGNHSIRQIDLIQQEVSTIAGTGSAGKLPMTGSDPLSISLSSPRDVLVFDNDLYVSMSGFFQIWKLDLEEGSFEPFIGSGSYGYLDGPLSSAQLSQVSGMVTDGNVLYFTDSEVSAIRTINWLDEEPEVTSLIGNGLFQFGDIDGLVEEALLQHPLGIDKQANFIFFTDTNNQKIKSINLDTMTVSTWAGTGEKGINDGVKEAAAFNFPHDISIAGNLIFIADTNNNIIRTVDIYTGLISTMQFTNLEAAYPYTPVTEGSIKSNQIVAAGEGKIVIALHISPGYKFNTNAPFYLYMTSDVEGVIEFINPTVPEIHGIPDHFPVVMDVFYSEGSTNLTIQGMLVFCEIEDENICTVEEINLQMDIQVSNDETINTVKINHYINAEDE